MIKWFTKMLKGKEKGEIAMLTTILLAVIVVIAIFKIAPILTAASAVAQADTNADGFLIFFYQIGVWIVLGFGILAIGWSVLKKSGFGS